MNISSIHIANGHKEYLRFWWENQLFGYNVLCFGLTSAHRIFTKRVKPVVAHLRQKDFMGQHIRKQSYHYASGHKCVTHTSLIHLQFAC